MEHHGCLLRSFDGIRPGAGATKTESDLIREAKVEAESRMRGEHDSASMYGYEDGYEDEEEGDEEEGGKARHHRQADRQHADGQHRCHDVDTTKVGLRSSDAGEV